MKPICNICKKQVEFDFTLMCFTCYNKTCNNYHKNLYSLKSNNKIYADKTAFKRTK